MNDRELLELAAKAAGIEALGVSFELDGTFAGLAVAGQRVWNPLIDDGDALRLAVRLSLSADFFDDAITVGYTPNDNECDQVVEPVGIDPYAATRRAIVRAAAKIGRAMP